MSDIDQGTDIDQPADDIRSLLDSAVTESETAATEAPASGKAAATEGDDATGERVRGADGKFTKKTDAADTAKTAKVDKATTDPKAAAEPKTAATDDPAKAAATATDPTEPPAHWSQADKDKFKALPAEGKAFVLDRFKAMEGDYTRKTQEVAHLKKEYGPVDELFAPHKEAMRTKGFTPRSLIEAWANVETKLAAGPDSAIEVIKGLVGGYKLPIDKIAAALGISAQTAPANDANGQQPTAVENGQVVALPPGVAAELKALREQVHGVTSWKSQQEQREQNLRQVQQQQEEAAVETTINEFKSAVDEKGNPLHPHFDEVRSMMDSLAQAALVSKQNPIPSLKELYETAVYATPSTRDKVLTAQRQQEEAKRTEEARTKAASARRAGSSVTGAPGLGQAPSGKPGSADTIRASLEAAFDDVEA
ncbi:hypothetical protein [Bradyrhizobium sp.]